VIYLINYTEFPYKNANISRLNIYQRQQEQQNKLLLTIEDSKLLFWMCYLNMICSLGNSACDSDVAMGTPCI